MLNDQDISKLSAVLATKKDLEEMTERSLSVFATKKDAEEIKGDLGDLKELIQGLIVASDSIAKSIGELRLEYAAISVQLSRHDRWIKEIAEKIGLKLATE